MESSLQVGLAIVGGLVLAGVVAYNAWNSRRHMPVSYTHLRAHET